MYTYIRINTLPNNTDDWPMPKSHVPNIEFRVYTYKYVQINTSNEKYKLGVVKLNIINLQCHIIIINIM